MDSSIATVLQALIDNGLIGQGHIIIIFLIVIFFAIRKFLMPSPEKADNDCIMIKEHEIKLNAIIDKINDITDDLQKLKTELESFDKKLDGNFYDIKLKIAETSQNIQKLESMRDLLTTLITTTVNK